MRTILNAETGEVTLDANEPAIILEDNRSATYYQLRKAMRSKGMMPTFKTYYETLTDNMQEDWQYSREIRIKDEIIDHMKLTLSLTTKQIKDLFNKAAEF